MATPVQQFIIDTLGTEPNINPAEEIRTRVNFLKEYLKGTGRKGFVLGISGGQDSSLAGRLSQMAVEELRAEGYEAKFLAVRLPYGEQKDEDDAQLALRFINPDDNLVFNIKDTVDAFQATFDNHQHANLTDYDKGNVKARVRMMTQYAYASAQRLLVIGTDHSAEALTGFFTVGGDGQADILPLSGLSKRQGKELLKELGAPERLYLKAPTADLLDEVPGQEDETELGVKYSVLDDFLEGKDVDPDVHDKIVNRYFLTEFKRNGPVAVADTWWKQP